MIGGFPCHEFCMVKHCRSCCSTESFVFSFWFKVEGERRLISFLYQACSYKSYGHDVKNRNVTLEHYFFTFINLIVVTILVCFVDFKIISDLVVKNKFLMNILSGLEINDWTDLYSAFCCFLVSCNRSPKNELIFWNVRFLLKKGLKQNKIAYMKLPDFLIWADT